MEKLISFIFENIYWVVIIGGVLFSMFGRQKGSGKSNPRMPEFGGGGPRNIFGQPNASEEQQQQSHPDLTFDRPEQFERPVKAVIAAAQDNVSGNDAATSGALARALKAAATLPEVQRGKSSGAASQTHSGASHAKLIPHEKDELRRAVIWSEILGPPRAKRPFGK